MNCAKIILFTLEVEYMILSLTVHRHLRCNVQCCIVVDWKINYSEGAEKFNSLSLELSTYACAATFELAHRSWWSKIMEQFRHEPLIKYLEFPWPLSSLQKMFYHCTKFDFIHIDSSYCLIRASISKKTRYTSLH